MQITLSTPARNPIQPEYPAAQNTTRNPTDNTFLMAVAYWTLDAAEMAQVGAGSDDIVVSAFAENTYRHAMEMHAQLQQLANGAVILPDKTSYSISAHKARMMNNSGADLDMAYLSYHTDAHTRIIDWFVKETEQGQYQPVVDFAVQHLKELRDKKRIADRLLLVQ